MGAIVVMMAYINCKAVTTVLLNNKAFVVFKVSANKCFNAINSFFNFL